VKIKLLVTGSTGQLGSEFCRQLKDGFNIIGITRNDADISDLARITKVINQHEPDCVIHTAAFTDVDACEIDSSKGMEINAAGAGNVALAAQKCGAEIVYFSTDYVFDGAKNSAYVESDAPNPISEYGRSKRAGELATMKFNKNWTIIRCGWIYGDHGKNFVKSILTSAKKCKSPLRVVSDQIGSPTWTKDVVEQTARIIEAKQRGLFHVAPRGEVSRFEFAKLILEKLMPGVKVEPCTAIEYPRPARRPARSSLTSEKLGKLGIDVIRPQAEALEEFLNEYGEQLLNEISN